MKSPSIVIVKYDFQGGSMEILRQGRKYKEVKSSKPDVIYPKLEIRTNPMKFKDENAFMELHNAIMKKGKI